MIVGTTILKMNGDAYIETPAQRQTTFALFTVQVRNLVGPGATSVDVTIEHRNRDEVAWGAAGVFPPILAPGVFSVPLAGLKELVRYKFAVSGAGTTETSGAHVFTPAPQWLVDY